MSQLLYKIEATSSGAALTGVMDFLQQCPGATVTNNSFYIGTDPADAFELSSVLSSGIYLQARATNVDWPKIMYETKDDGRYYSDNGAYLGVGWHYYYELTRFGKSFETPLTLGLRSESPTTGLYATFDGATLTLATRYGAENLLTSILSMGIYTHRGQKYRFIYSSYSTDIINGNRPRLVMVSENGNTFASIDVDFLSYSETVTYHYDREQDRYYTHTVDYDITDNFKGVCYSTIMRKDENMPNIPEYTRMDRINTPFGHPGFVNELNEIAMIMPCQFFIKDSPHLLNVYKYAGQTDSIGYVSLYNMGNFHITQVRYPHSGDRYVCMQLHYLSASNVEIYSFRGIAARLTEQLEKTVDDGTTLPSVQ